MSEHLDHPPTSSLPNIYRGELLKKRIVNEDATTCLAAFLPQLKAQGHDIRGKIMTDTLPVGQESSGSIAFDGEILTVEDVLTIIESQQLHITGWVLETPETRIECDQFVSDHPQGTLLNFYRQDAPDIPLAPEA